MAARTHRLQLKAPSTAVKNSALSWRVALEIKIRQKVLNHRDPLSLTRLVGILVPYSKLLTEERKLPDLPKLSTSAPKEAQQTQDAPGIAQPKRTNPFARVPQVSKDAQQTQGASGATQPKRTNPFARVPQVSSASAEPSSSSQPPSSSQTEPSSRYGTYQHHSFSSPLNTLSSTAIPDIRRPGLFPARRQGNDPLSPPAANFKAKNPFKERKRRT